MFDFEIKSIGYHCLFKYKLIFIILKLSDVIFDISINIISNSP